MTVKKSRSYTHITFTKMFLFDLQIKFGKCSKTTDAKIDTFEYKRIEITTNLNLKQSKLF